MPFFWDRIQYLESEFLHSETTSFVVSLGLSFYF